MVLLCLERAFRVPNPDLATCFNCPGHQFSIPPWILRFPFLFLLPPTCGSRPSGPGAQVKHRSFLDWITRDGVLEGLRLSPFAVRSCCDVTLPPSPHDPPSARCWCTGQPAH